MRREYAVIEAPLITEKGTYVNEIGNQVVFQVSRSIRACLAGRCGSWRRREYWLSLRLPRWRQGTYSGPIGTAGTPPGSESVRMALSHGLVRCFRNFCGVVFRSVLRVVHGDGRREARRGVR